MTRGPNTWRENSSSRGYIQIMLTLQSSKDSLFWNGLTMTETFQKTYHDVATTMYISGQVPPIEQA